MKKLLLNIALMTGAISAQSQTSSVREVSGSFSAPESVVAHCKYLFVSNMGSKVDPTAKDGDGYISELSRRDGKMVEEKFITGLNSPKGLKIIHGMLLVADVDRVVAYKIKTRKKIWEADLSKEGIGYANDISIRHCGSIYVSSTDKDAVYKVCRKGKVKKLPVNGDISGANGLFHAGCKLYIANYGHKADPDGSFGAVSLGCHKKYKMYGSGGVYDGIQKVCHRIVVSDWVSRGEAKGKGRLVAYRPCKKESTEISIGVPLSGPSDIYADGKYKTLWVPCMLDNKLVAVPYSLIKAKK